jgi:hypothetical protein
VQKGTTTRAERRAAKVAAGIDAMSAEEAKAKLRQVLAPADAPRPPERVKPKVRRPGLSAGPSAP